MLVSEEGRLLTSEEVGHWKIFAIDPNSGSVESVTTGAGVMTAVTTLGGTLLLAGPLGIQRLPLPQG
jgi:hypothetical protein